MNKGLPELLNIDFPLIMAPMFLVSNREMIKAGMKAGIMATFPSLNFRATGELSVLLEELNAHHLLFPRGNYCVNLIVQQSNPLYKAHLKICADKKVPFYITSLGSPKEVIEKGTFLSAHIFKCA